MKVKNYMLIDGKFYIIKESKNKTKALQLIKHNKLNISELGRKLKLSAQTTNDLVRFLERTNFIYQKKSNKQYNPSYLYIYKPYMKKIK